MNQHQLKASVNQIKITTTQEHVQRRSVQQKCFQWISHTKKLLMIFKHLVVTGLSWWRITCETELNIPVCVCVCFYSLWMVGTRWCNRRTAELSTNHSSELLRARRPRLIHTPHCCVWAQDATYQDWSEQTADILIIVEIIVVLQTNTLS